jgi:hypothetical protein
MRTRKQYVLAVLLGTSIGLALYAINYAQTRHVKQAPPPPKERVTSVPEVISCVKNIKVVNVKLIADVPLDESVEVEVENTGEIGIIAILLETSNGRETYGVMPSAFEEDEPAAIIEPHATYTLTIAANNITPHGPYQIGSVAYIDGTEEGCEEALKTMRGLNARHEAIKAKRKGSPQ